MKKPYLKIVYPHYVKIHNSYEIRNELKKLGFQYGVKVWEISLPTIVMKPWIIDELRRLGVENVEKLEEFLRDENDSYLKLFKKLIEYVRKELGEFADKIIEIRFNFARGEIRMRFPKLSKEQYLELRKKVKYDPILYEFVMKMPDLRGQIQ